MALNKKVYGVNIWFSALILAVYGIFAAHSKSPKTVAPQSEIGNLAGLQLEGQFVSDKGDEFGIRGFSLGIADGIAEKPLQSIQIASVPGYFDGVSNCSLHSAGCGLECFRHLGVEHLGDGVRVPDGPRRGYQEPPQNEGFFRVVYRFVCWSMRRCFIGFIRPM